MKVSLNWLSDYVDIAMPAAQLAERLMNVGINCDGIAPTADDVVLDLEITSNRPDCLGHIGIAREVATATGAAFHPPVVPALPAGGNVSELAAVQVLQPQLCPRYTARLIRGVKVGPSPAWLIERLEAVGMRSINNIVDITNFVLMEYSQPLHSFDHDKLAGHRIIVRPAAAGEQIVAIDGTRCQLDESMLVIADERRPVAIAGVMGGLETEVSQGTVNVLIESAQFDPLCIRQTSRKLGLMSESNYRFERGVDALGVDAASLRACQLILQLAGGQLCEGVIDVWAQPYQPPAVSLRPSRCDAVLGVSVPLQRQLAILASLGLSPQQRQDEIVCTIPSYRRDLRREIDLIEEIARLEGYEKVPLGRQVSHEVVVEKLPQRTRRELQAALSAAGFDEALTFSFVDQAEAELMGFDRVVTVDPRVRKSNNVLRPALLSSLLRACKVNQDAGNGDVSLFELASAFPPSADHAPAEHVELAMVTSLDLRRLRGAVETLVERLTGRVDLQAEPATAPGMDEGACAVLKLQGAALGALGMVDQKVLDYYGLERPYAAAALRFEPLMQHAGAVRKYQPIAKFPPVRRDISFIVPDATAWKQLHQAILELSQAELTAVEYVTTYRGKPIAAGSKSVTVTLTYRSPSGTLRSEQVDQQVAAVMAHLKKELSAEIRV